MHFMYILIIRLSALYIQGILNKQYDKLISRSKACPMMSSKNG